MQLAQLYVCWPCCLCAGDEVSRLATGWLCVQLCMLDIVRSRIAREEMIWHIFPPSYLSSLYCDLV